MSFFNNGTGKYLADAFDRGVASIKEFFSSEWNAKREEGEQLNKIQDTEDVVGEEKEHTGFFSDLFDNFFGGGSSSIDQDSSNDPPEDFSRYGNDDSGQAMQDALDRQEREQERREDEERQVRDNEER